MPDFTKIIYISLGNLSKIQGISADSIEKVDGLTPDGGGDEEGIDQYGAMVVMQGVQNQSYLDQVIQSPQSDLTYEYEDDGTGASIFRIRADKFVNNAATGAPQLTYGAEVVAGVGITGAGGIDITGVTTSTGGFVGNVTGNINASSSTGISTVGVLTAYSSIHIKVGSGSTEVATELSNKTSPGKAIALSMVFG